MYKNAQNAIFPTTYGIYVQMVHKYHIAMYKNAQNAIFPTTYGIYVQMYINTILLCTKMPRMPFFHIWYLCTNVHKYHIAMYKNAQNAIFPTTYGIYVQMYINTILLCTKMPRMPFSLRKMAFWAFLYIAIWYLCTFVHKYHMWSRTPSSHIYQTDLYDQQTESGHPKSIFICI